MIWVYAFLGLLVGALLNHAANVLPRRQALGQPPRCRTCEADLPLRQWFSIAALASGRRCAQCQEPLPWRGLILEIITALLFAFLWRAYGPSWPLALFTLFTVIFELVFVIDLEHRLILNVVIYPAIVFAAAASFFRPDLGYRLALLGGALGFVLVLLIYLAGPLFVRLWSRMRGETTTEVPFGFGDVKLALYIGLVVGFPAVVFALIIGMLLAGLGAALFIVARRSLGRRYVALTAIPYGPFLVAGGLLMLYYGAPIMSAYLGAYQ